MSQTEISRDAVVNRVLVEGGCWLWQERLDSRGYGMFPRHLRAHRVSYTAFKGPIPAGLHVLHSCDNPRCVNPDHLSVGTPADNMRDKMLRGRARGAHPGEAHAMAKLTEAQVLEIRADGRIHRLIAADYGVGRRTIGDIKRRRCWVHI